MCIVAFEYGSLRAWRVLVCVGFFFGPLRATDAPRQYSAVRECRSIKSFAFTRNIDIFFSALLKGVMEGDPHRVTLGMLVASCMASSNHISVIPASVRWHLNTYTNWNLALIIVRVLFSLREWDPFLCVNSVGIWLGFRTAFAKGLDEHIRQKMEKMGLHLKRFQFVLADAIVHALPAVLLTSLLIVQRRRIPIVSVTYAITLSSWFAFCQGGKLDASAVYVPHPWKRAWMAGVIGMMAAPNLVDAIQDNKKRKLLTTIFAMLSIYLSTRLDSSIWKKYKFEYILSKAAPKEQATMHHTRSDPALDVLSSS